MTPPDVAAGTTRLDPAGRLSVGLLGAGRMGSAMAGRLAGEGHDVVVYNRTADRARQLADRIGSRVAASAAEAAAGVDVLISMVADDEAVETLYRGSGGVLEGIGSRTVAVDMSTVLPDTLRNLAPEIAARGAGVLDAPVSGSVTTAQAGELTIMVGGSTADLDRARPVLDSLGKRVFHLGALGTGATMKLAVNAVIFGLNNALAEGLVLAERAGVDRMTAYDVLAASAVGAPYVQYKRGAFVEPESTPAVFSISLAEKDLGLILELARRVDAAMPQARTNLRVFEETGGQIGDDRDFADVAVHLRSRRADMA